MRSWCVLAFVVIPVLTNIRADVNLQVDDASRAALVRALAATGQTQLLKSFLDSREQALVDFADEQCMTALYFAAASKQSETCRLLLEKGADPLARTKQEDTPSQDDTPLQRIIESWEIGIAMFEMIELSFDKLQTRDTSICAQLAGLAAARIEQRFTEFRNSPEFDSLEDSQKLRFLEAEADLIDSLGKKAGGVAQNWDEAEWKSIVIANRPRCDCEPTQVAITFTVTHPTGVENQNELINWRLFQPGASGICGSPGQCQAETKATAAEDYCVSGTFRGGPSSCGGSIEKTVRVPLEPGETSVMFTFQMSFTRDGIELVFGKGAGVGACANEFIVMVELPGLMCEETAGPEGHTLGPANWCAADQDDALRSEVVVSWTAVIE